MGRQAFITRLVLGRSAFEPADSQSSQDRPVKLPAKPDTDSKHSNDDSEREKKSRRAQSSSEAGLLTRSAQYEQQQYDSKGHPRNPSSEAAKRHWRHAVNDVLATVGVCVTKGRAPVPFYGAHNSALVDEAQLQNQYGTIISSIDMVVRIGTEHWSGPLKQRIQTFKFYSGVPLLGIIKSEWARFGGMQFLFAGIPSALLFVLLDDTTKIVTRYAFNTLRRVVNGRSKTSPGWKNWKNKLLGLAETLTNVSLFILIAPLDFYSILQQLDLVPMTPLIPHARAYLSIFPAIFSQKERFGYFKYFALSYLIYNFHYRHNLIGSKISEYVWAALPKPTQPDGLSMLAAQRSQLEISSVAVLVKEINENDPRGVWVSTSLVDQLKYDLQSIGRNWQILWDQCAELLSSISRPTTGSPRGVEGLRRSHNPTERFFLEHLNEDQASMEPFELPVTATDTEQITRTSHLRRTFQPSNSPPNPLQSHGSSSSSSLIDTPHSIELTSHDQNGELHVSLFLSTQSNNDVGGPVLPAGPQRPFHPTGSAMDSADQYVDALQNGAQPPQSSRDEPTSRRHPNATRTRRNFDTPHRVTTLSAHPAYGITERVTLILTDTLFLPLEALYLRTLAFAFLSSPKQSSPSTDAAARWKKEVYPPLTWLTPRSHAGGLREFGSYVGKLMLVIGLQASVSFVTWQIGTGLIWWVGRTCNAWKRPKGDSSAKKVR